MCTWGTCVQNSSCCCYMYVSTHVYYNISIVWSTCIQLFLLEELRERKYDGFARKIQKAWRRYKSEQYFYELKKKGTYCIVVFRYNEHLTTSPVAVLILMVRVINGRQYRVYTPSTSHINIDTSADLSHRDGVWYWLLTTTGTNFDTSITEDNLNSAV